MTDSDNALVEIDGLVINFYTYQGTVQAIEGVDLTIQRGETLGLVGETGCGKSVTASAIVGLILSPPGKIEQGDVYFMEPPDVRAKRRQYERQAQEWYKRLPLKDRRDLAAQFAVRYTGFKRRVKRIKASELKDSTPPEIAPQKLVASYMQAQIKKTPKSDKVAHEALTRNYNLLGKELKYMQKIRGRYISMIFQEPTSALNPVFTAGDQISEVIIQHRKPEMADRVLARLKIETQLLKEHKRPRTVPLSKGDMKALGPSSNKAEAAAKAGFKCSVCGGTVDEDNIYCVHCGAVFHSWLSWLVRPMVLRTYTTIMESIKKNPDGRQSIIRRIPILRRYKTELEDEALKEAVKMLDVVRIPDPMGVASRYPFELSGGMQQRVMIAIALACNPKLLIADEPTTALDVTIQGQILKLMRDLKTKYGSSILLITHNLGVVAEMCDRVGVMYAGSMAEIGKSREIFKQPLHPYTMGLMKSVPSIQMNAEKLYTIRGSVPNLIYPPSGCRFHPRCDHARSYCTKVRPVMTEVEPGHFAACHMVTKEEGYVHGS